MLYPFRLSQLLPWKPLDARTADSHSMSLDRALIWTHGDTIELAEHTVILVATIPWTAKGDSEIEMIRDSTVSQTSRFGHEVSCLTCYLLEARS